MNPSSLIKKLSANGIHVRVDGEDLEVRHKNPLSKNQLQYLKQHKTEIIDYLLPSNQSRYNRYAYRFTLKNNKGGGTYITDSPPSDARNELIDRFLNREIESFNLLN